MMQITCPGGFTLDRQQNQRNPETITYFFNYDVMKGAPANQYRDEITGTDRIGLQIIPRPDKGFVRYEACGLIANSDLLVKALNPNSTTLIDIVLQRLVSKEVFRLKLTADSMPSEEEGNFRHTEPGTEYIM
ncbi:MAG: hypothetical protein IPH45_21460 [Bacteroidales bacterium]|nr:hypothetical protein [Bacteroidales bacterium]